MNFEKGLTALAEAIKDAEDRHRHACMTGSTMQQVGLGQHLDDLKYAFALITGTAVGGMHFNDELKKRLKI